ncbi:MAG: hypothetical protein RL479_1128, partial [Verrucomicrobiota bacterium]
MGDDHDPAGVARADEIARVDLAQAEAARERGLDPGVGELAAGVVHIGLIGRAGALAVGHQGLGGLELLLGHQGLGVQL